MEVYTKVIRMPGLAAKTKWYPLKWRKVHALFGEATLVKVSWKQILITDLNYNRILVILYVYGLTN
jgi:hypothetical protein